MAATAEMVQSGGYDAVQMRDVASRADVALGTLYRYFSSKEYLLVSMMKSDVDVLAAALAEHPAKGSTAAERVRHVLHRANGALLRHAEVTAAHVRALVSGSSDVAPVVGQVTDTMRGIILSAMGDDDADSGRSVAVADTLFDVWLAALVGWITGVTAAEGVQRKLDRTIELLLEVDR